jgi:hypothetical protein
MTSRSSNPSQLLGKKRREDPLDLVLESRTRNHKQKNTTARGKPPSNTQKCNNMADGWDEEMKEAFASHPDKANNLAEAWAMKVSQQALEKLMSDTSTLKEMFNHRLIEMEAGLLEKMKAAVVEEMQAQKRQTLDMELQKTIVAKDMTQRREEKGGYDFLKELQNDATLRLKMER